MKCPRTGSELKRIKVGGIIVDVSTKCGGVFFDNFEIENFDEQHEFKGEKLAEHISQFNAAILDENQRIACPKCSDIIMMRRYYSPKKSLEIDECPQCAGIWLDAGELSTLRKIFISEEERNKLGEILIKEVEQQNPNVIAYKNEHEKSIARMESFKNILWGIIGTYRRY